MVENGVGEEKGGGKRVCFLTLLVCNGTDCVDQAVQRGHELGVAADTGEVGDLAARGGDAGFYCGGLLEVRIVLPRGTGRLSGGRSDLQRKWVSHQGLQRWQRERSRGRERRRSISFFFLLFSCFLVFLFPFGLEGFW